MSTKNVVLNMSVLSVLILSGCAGSSNTGRSFEEVWAEGDSSSSTAPSKTASSGNFSKPASTEKRSAIISASDFSLKAPAADELCQAIESGDGEAVRAIIASKSKSINGMDKQGRTPLGVAVRNNHVDFVTMLLEAGAHVNKKDQSGRSPLYLACETNNPEMVELLFSNSLVMVKQDELDERLIFISAYLDIEGFVREMGAVLKNAENQKTQRSYEVAQDTLEHLGEIGKDQMKSPEFIRKRLKIAEILLEQGGNPNADVHGASALTSAVFNHTSDSLELLLKNGADPNSGGALLIAVTISRTENVHLLLAAGADPLHLRKNVPVGSPESPFIVTGMRTTDSPLSMACVMGDIEIVKQLLAVIKDPSRLSEDSNGLRVAAKTGNVELVKLLLNHGASTKAKSKDGVTALHGAAMYNSEEVTQVLIAAGSEINARDSAGFTPLASAAERNNNRQIRVLLDHGAQVDVANDLGMTPYLIASGFGFSNTVNILLEAGADSYAKTSQDLNALQLAARGAKDTKFSGPEVSIDHLGTVKTLLEVGLPADGRGGRMGYPPLNVACNFNQVEIARVLLAHGAPVDAINSQDGSTSLYHAAGRGSPELVTLLLAHGADIEAKASNDPLRQTPLILASGEGKSDNVKLLLEHGANYEAKTSQGASALHIAAWMNRVEVAKLLLAAGIKVDARDNQDMTPLHLAANFGNRDIAALLIKNAANVNAVGMGGATPLALATHNRRYTTANLLKEHGARLSY